MLWEEVLCLYMLDTFNQDEKSEKLTQYSQCQAYQEEVLKFLMIGLPLKYHFHKEDKYRDP